jgi:hypothetical protein
MVFFTRKLEKSATSILDLNSRAGYAPAAYFQEDSK